jgi:hypothetical protein
MTMFRRGLIAMFFFATVVLPAGPVAADFAADVDTCRTGSGDVAINACRCPFLDSMMYSKAIAHLLGTAPWSPTSTGGVRSYSPRTYGNFSTICPRSNGR